MNTTFLSQFIESFDNIVHHKEDDMLDFIRQRDHYFRTLIEINGNQELRRLIPKLQVHLVRNRPSVPHEKRIENYRKITDAILAGKEKAAETAARRYVRIMASHVLPQFPE